MKLWQRRLLVAMLGAASLLGTSYGCGSVSDSPGDAASSDDSGTGGADSNEPSNLWDVGRWDEAHWGP